MPTLQKINSYLADINNGVHNLASANIKVALTDVAPTAASTNLASITEISYTNLSARAITTTSSTQTSGIYSLILADLTLSASGAVAQFRYIVLYDDSAASKQLLGYVDNGTELNLTNGDTLKLDFDNTNGVIQIS